MKTQEEKYLNDPQYHALVDTMEKAIIDAQFTPSEMREAATLAAIHYEQHRTRQYHGYRYTGVE
jgi:hypothetical protein